MTPLWLAVVALSWLLLVVAAWLVARRDREHRWLAAYLTWMAAADHLRPLLRQLRGTAKPYVGLARAVFHFDQLIVLSWSFLFVALCAHHFVRRRDLVPYAAWTFAFLVCLNYPLLSGQPLVWVYKAVAVWALAAAWVYILWGMTRRRDLEPGLAHLV